MGQHMDTLANFEVLKYKHNWTKIYSHLNYQVVKDLNNGLQAQQYHDLKLYEIRNSSPCNFVKVYQVALQSLPSFCGNSINMKVYVQRIPYRLRDIGRINYHQGLYILQTILVALKQLSSYYPLVIIEQDMIGFNIQGQCKVWINQDFSNNSASKNNQKITQQKVINSLMLLIEPIMEKQQSYQKKKQKENIINFEEAIKFIQKQRRSLPVNVQSIQIPNDQQQNKYIHERSKYQNIIDQTRDYTHRNFDKFMNCQVKNQVKKNICIEQKDRKSKTFTLNDEVAQGKNKLKFLRKSTKYFKIKLNEQKIASPTKKSLKQFNKTAFSSAEKCKEHICLYDNIFLHKKAFPNIIRNK